jgi:hypothetical protein
MRSPSSIGATPGSAEGHGATRARRSTPASDSVSARGRPRSRSPETSNGAARRAGAGFALVARAGRPAEAEAGNALGLHVDPVRRVDGAFCASYAVEDPFPPKLEEPLLRGMPATVTFEVGVWKRRAFWFDKLVVAYRSEHKIAYDPWNKSFLIRSGVNVTRTRSVPDLDSLKSFLFRARDLPVALAASLDSAATHYVSVKVVVRPLSASDLGEIEDWLAGSDSTAAYLLEWAVNLSGLGEKSALEKSPPFVPRELVAGPGAPAISERAPAR